MIGELQGENDPSIIRIDSYYNYDGTLPINGRLDIISTECTLGSVYVTPISQDYTRSFITGTFGFDNFHDFAYTLFTPNVQDSLPHLLSTITFPGGLSFLTSYRTINSRNAVVFQGDADFLGVDAAGRVSLDLDTNIADVRLLLPMFSIGGGTLQFLSVDDLSTLYGITRNQRGSQNFYFSNNFDDLENPNVISTSIDQVLLQGSIMRLDVNMLLLGIVSRVNQIIDERTMVFTVHGNPFNGAFTAENTVQVTPVPDIEAENNSILDVVLDRAEEFNTLEQQVNERFQQWMTRIIRIGLQTDRLIAEYAAQINYLSERYIPDEQCRPEDY